MGRSSAIQTADSVSWIDFVSVMAEEHRRLPKLSDRRHGPKRTVFSCFAVFFFPPVTLLFCCRGNQPI
jgi:hypothetical protein